MRLRRHCLDHSDQLLFMSYPHWNLLCATVSLSADNMDAPPPPLKKNPTSCVVMALRCRGAVVKVPWKCTKSIEVSHISRAHLAQITYINNASKQTADIYVQLQLCYDCRINKHLEINAVDSKIIPPAHMADWQRILHSVMRMNQSPLFVSLSIQTWYLSH